MPEGRQQIAKFVQELREWADDDVLGMRRDVSMRKDQFVDVADLEKWAALMHKAADSLALLLAEAHLQVAEKTEDTDTRVEPMGNSKDNPTASENERTPATVTPHSTDEFGWVIERHFHSQLHYWTGRHNEALGAWASQHDDALRFARRTDAECMLTWHLGGVGNVVQHGWAGDGRRGTSDASRPAAPDVAEGDRSTTPDQGRHQLRERLAALCHEQWSGWMTYLFSRTFPDNDGNVVIPRDWAARWRRQMETPYSHLARHEQNSDRKEADRVITILGGGNQQGSGLRGDPGAPRTVNGEARDKASSSNSPAPVTPTEDQT